MDLASMCNSVEVAKKMKVQQMFDRSDTLSTSARPIDWQTGKRFRQLWVLLWVQSIFIVFEQKAFFIHFPIVKQYPVVSLGIQLFMHSLDLIKLLASNKQYFFYFPLVFCIKTCPMMMAIFDLQSTKNKIKIEKK